jgi:hypothetical protein
MSQLLLANNAANWKLNVTQFNSPIYNEVSTSQTKLMAMHFPIRCNQPEIQFNVQFRSENEYENFQRFVRAHQQDALQHANLVSLSWPERNINNWTGVIKKFRAGGMRFNFAPTATFTVDLVDSMVSSRMELVSEGLLWQTIYGAGMGPDAVLSAPTAFENNLLMQMFGQDLNGNVAPQTGGIGGGLNPTPGVNPAQPGVGPAGIGAGS